MSRPRFGFWSVISALHDPLDFAPGEGLVERPFHTDEARCIAPAIRVRGEREAAEGALDLVQ